MRETKTSYSKEPLLHFIIAGIAVFFIFEFTGNKDGVDEKVIYVFAAQIDLMDNHWERQLGRPPTEDELQGLIDGHIREEILMHEAYAMGLDKDDIIIRRRLAQKMEFISGDMLTVAEPTEEEIEAFYNEHGEQFKEPGKVSFLQIYFSVDKRSPEESEALAAQLKSDLEEKDISTIDITELGDRTMIRPDYIDLSADGLKSEFGDAEIVEKVIQSPVNQWSGPVSSNYGFHLIYVLERKPDYIPALEDLAYTVKNEMIDERKKALDKQFMTELRERYTVNIDEAIFEKYKYKKE